MADTPEASAFSRIRRYLITGLLAAIPLAITWFAIHFVFNLLASIGKPLAQHLANSLKSHSPIAAKVVDSDLLLSVVGAILVVVVLIAIGYVATNVIGARLVAWFHDLMERLPLVKTVYGAVRKLIATFQEQPTGSQRVVLISFPSPEMKTVGMVTRTFIDAGNGRELAAVYVPTTPNPTSGYLEIVPIEDVTPTDWTMDEAMNFIVSGGAVAPDRIIFNREDALKATEKPQKEPEE